MTGAPSPRAQGLQRLPAALHDIFHRYGTLHRYQPRETIIREGERCENIYFLEEGWAYRFTVSDRGNRQLLGVVVRGEMFNVDSLALPSLSYSVRAITPISVVRISKIPLKQLSMESIEVADFLRREAALENAMLGRLAFNIGQKSTNQRLAYALCEIAERLGFPLSAQEQIRFDLPVTQELFGDLVGVTAVHVNRMLQQLRPEGIIKLENRILTILNVSALKNLAGYDERLLKL